MKNFKIDQYFEFTFNTQTVAGVAADASALPTWRVYEENNDTVIANGECAKRDDANTLGYYYARGQCTTAAGYEVGKTYEVRVAATVDTVAGAAVVGRFAILPVNVWDSLYGGTDYLETDVTQWKGATAPAMSGDAFARLGAPAGASVSADIAALAGGAGAITDSVTVYKSDGVTPADGAEVWITATTAVSPVLAGTKVANALGQVSFNLDTGTYYLHVQQAGQEFSSYPRQFTVAAGGFTWV